MTLETLEAFIAVVEVGSISKACEQLTLTRPTVSRRLAHLEKKLGVALLHRTTRRVRPTPDGRRLYQRIKPILSELHTAISELQGEQEEITGVLRVSVPPVIAQRVSAVLFALTHRHRQLSVELLSEVQLVDLRSGTVDVVLRAGPVVDGDLVQKKLVSRNTRAVASPEYLRKNPILSIDELPQRDLLLTQGRHTWPLQSGGRLAVNGRFVTDDQRVLLNGALEGKGVALLTEYSYRDAVERGALEVVLPKQIGSKLDLHLVLARRTLLPRRVQVFVEAVSGAHLW